jgi:hypothetical protein
MTPRQIMVVWLIDKDYNRLFFIFCKAFRYRVDMPNVYSKKQQRKQEIKAAMRGTKEAMDEAEQGKKAYLMAAWPEFSPTWTGTPAPQ